MSTPACEDLLRLCNATTMIAGRRFGPFDVALEPGQRVAILGPSGAGKSTLLRLMAGEWSVSSGEALYRQRAIGQWSVHELAKHRAVLPQSHSVAFSMPVDLVVALGRIARGSESQQAQIVSKSLQTARAGHLSSRRFDTLSGGEQARVQLARVFAQLWDVHDGLILVDEPLAALDPGLQFELMDALIHYAEMRRHALVAVLHDLNQALGNFDRLWLVQSGQLIADLPCGKDALSPLERLFGIRLRAVEDEHGRLAVLTRRASETDTLCPAMS
jgi:iron complex transport system ATP-binding protein